jgi:cytidine deaminase
MPTALSPATRRRLTQAARSAARSAYAPYSHFRVGAAILTGSGRIYSGANVENASYGLCNCAERTAIFAAAAAGERRLRAVVVYTPTASPTLPCGACRQVIHEFGPKATILSLCRTAAQVETTLDQLLPSAFGPASLH